MDITKELENVKQNAIEQLKAACLEDEENGHMMVMYCEFNIVFKLRRGKIRKWSKITGVEQILQRF